MHCLAQPTKQSASVNVNTKIKNDANNFFMSTLLVIYFLKIVNNSIFNTFYHFFAFKATKKHYPNMN